jgi:hypothetical protein
VLLGYRLGQAEWAAGLLPLGQHGRGERRATAHVHRIHFIFFIFPENQEKQCNKIPLYVFLSISKKRN